MPLTVAVQMDPIERINVASDSTFALMLEAKARGHKLLVYTPDKLSMLDGKVSAPMREADVRDVVGDHVTLGEARRVDLKDTNVVLMRQDPPFDLAYITATHLLERVHPGSFVVNDPGSVRNAPEKIFVTEFPELMPPTLITRDKAEIEAFRRQHGEVVMKPLHGHGGASVFKVAREDANFGSLYDLFSSTFKEAWVVQRFLPQVVKGDKRIVLVDGVAKGAVIGPALRKRGLIFVGIDVIDGYLTEINVTCPTGIRAIRNTGGPDLAPVIWDAIESKL
jgi:glutathione synthase